MLLFALAAGVWVDRLRRRPHHDRGWSRALAAGLLSQAVGVRPALTIATAGVLISVGWLVGLPVFAPARSCRACLQDL